MRRSASGKSVYAAILAGGAGTRLWPLSSVAEPKQLLRIDGRESLLGGAIRRLTPPIPAENVFIVASKAQAGAASKHLRTGGPSFKGGYIIEGPGRNTAPAIALAAFEFYLRDPGAIMAVLPSDHIIGDTLLFRRALRGAIEAAAGDRLVIFGVLPTRPETGYGYIKASGRAKRIGPERLLSVERFVEKPNIRRARSYVKEGGWFWNSGIGVWKAERILEEIKRHLPAVYRAAKKVHSGRGGAKAFASLKPVSIDRGVLEKADSVSVIPAPFDWSDVGSWSALCRSLRSDRRGNSILGDCVDIDSTGSTIITKGIAKGPARALVTIGLKDILVVDTPEGTLICPKDRAEELGGAIAKLKKRVLKKV